MARVAKIVLAIRDLVLVRAGEELTLFIVINIADIDTAVIDSLDKKEAIAVEAVIIIIIKGANIPYL